jgi:hypothetical protein
VLVATVVTKPLLHPCEPPTAARDGGGHLLAAQQAVPTHRGPTILPHHLAAPQHHLPLSEPQHRTRTLRVCIATTVLAPPVLRGQRTIPGREPYRTLLDMTRCVPITTWILPVVVNLFTLLGGVRVVGKTVFFISLLILSMMIQISKCSGESLHCAVLCILAHLNLDVAI